MNDVTQLKPKKQVRSTRPDFDGPDDFANKDEALEYYKAEYARLKAIIALQKEKIQNLVRGSGS